MTEPLNLGFNAHAMVKPKTREEVAIALKEAFSILEDVNEQFETLFDHCAAARRDQLHGPQLPMAKQTYTYGSMRKTAQEWADYFGVTFQYLYSVMMTNGWSYEKAVDVMMKKKSQS
jgi:predicted 3-demethylubiquinone-9 3-methyltransferase (glyoxalase superfamily)